ncbi:MAG: NAD-dependent epimerase/dehydratase family protein, partial [Tepidisphaeraceae bacterium]
MKIAVTGAFGYSGRYIAQRLLDAGHSVITLTNSLRRENPFGDRVAAFPFNFDNRVALAESLAGVDALINTYWVRFDHALFTHDEAVANTKTLFAAAKRAGVRRIVHISITNPDLHSALPYFRGKAELELALQSLGVSHCILRPTVLFGREDILINNLAWGLRHLPVFAVFGAGDYRLQPIHVDDLAAACVDQAAGSENQIINAIGPETFSYRGLVETVRATLGLIRPILSLPPEIAYLGCRALGIFTRDVVITRQEIEGLMEDRLYVDAPPLGATSLTHWIKANRQTLGLHYTS